MTQEAFISVSNKHIEEYLDYYFNGRKNLEYAVLINGAWGSGKTWYVKKYIEKIQKTKKIAYISLNGVSKSSEIDDAIFKCIHPVLGSKQAKLTGQILKGAIKATLKIDLNGDSKSDGSLNASVPDIKLPEYLRVDDNFILIFDDLERCELKIEETLGYINYFVEQESIKVLVVSNDAEIKENDNFIKKKEKLIGATFNYSEDQDLAIKCIIEEVDNFELKEKLVNIISFITEIFNRVGYKNLRAFKQSIFDFQRFYRKNLFEWNGNFDQEIFKKILKAFLILSLENKKGRFNEVILTFKLNSNENNSKTTEKKIAELLSGFEGDDAQEFKKKYQMNLDEFIFSKQLWNKILNENIISITLIEKELYDVYFRLKEDSPVWIKLWSYLNLTDLEFADLVGQAKESIEKYELTEVADILHTISMLIFFSEKKLIDFSITPLLDIAVVIFKRIINIDDRYKRINCLDLRSQSGGYGLYAKNLTEFQIFLNRLESAYEEKYLEKNSERSSELLKLMQTDDYAFYEKITKQYFDYPIFKYFKVEEYLDRLCEIRYESAMSVLDTFSYRYKVVSQSPIYLQEQGWFEELIVLTNNKLKKSKGIEKNKIEEYFIPKLSQIKEEAYKG